MLKQMIAPLLLALVVMGGTPMTATAAPAETLEKSTDMSVEAAVDSFLAVLGAKGATVFAVVDHANSAIPSWVRL